MENKVKFNLSHVHYAKLTEGDTTTYEKPVPIPGAVKISLEPNGEPESFYADGGSYYTINNNMGYDGDLEIFLEKIVVRQEIIKCWDNFEKCLKSKDKKLTIPVKKSKIRTYLEVLNPNTEKGRKACKEVYRDYTDNTKWDIGNLDIECVKKLKSFLDKYVNE